MAKTEFLIRAIHKGLNLILVENEIAIRPQQIVGHKVGIMRRRKYLTVLVEQNLAYLKGQFEVVESIKRQ